MRHASSGRFARLVIGGLLALAIAGVTITSAAGSSSSVAPQKLCGGDLGSIDGVPRAQCLAEFIPGASRSPVARPFALAPSTSCPTYFEDQGQGKSPCEILRSYNVPGPTTQSASQVIGIVDAFDNPSIATELAQFDSLYGIASLPACGGGVTQSCFQKVNQSGSASPLPSSPPSDDDWKPEISLDVESAHAVCPNCKILLVEANSDSFSNLATAVATAQSLGATVISNSYGLAESKGSQALYNAYAATYDNGVPTFVSAGDDGWAPAFPADVPAVISVGGTSLTTDGSGGRSSESVWTGTGSGCSGFASAEPWQKMTTGWGATGCGSKRSIADVSAVADPDTGLIIYTEGGWYQYGGTSLSSPLIAAMYALAANGTTPAAPVETAYWNASDFFDITSGSNGSCGTKACKAGVGYDGPTGIGTPNGVAGFAPQDTTPTVTSLDPTSGSPGTNVAISGAFIGDATSVKLGAESLAFSVLSTTQLQVTIPADAVDGVFEVTTPDGVATSDDEFDVTADAPTITTFAPAKGAQGATVKVTGKNLAGTTDVEVNGTAADFTDVTATSLSFTVPAGATTGQISVTNAGGTTSSAGNFAIAPTIDGFEPASGIVGSTFDLTGSGLTGVTAAKIGTKTAGLALNSDTSATITVPVGATTGKVALTGPGGTATSSATFTVVPPPTIASFAPTAAVEGASVTVTGAHLAGATVTLNEDDAVVTKSNSTSITFTVPDDATSGRIAVTTSAGTATSSGSFHVKPKITSFTGSPGKVDDAFDVTGTGFNGVTSAKLGTKAAPVTVHSDTSATVTVPAGATSGKVSLTGPGGTATSTATFTVMPPPKITSLTPAHAVEGASVKIVGTALAGAEVTLGGDDVSVTKNTSTSITFTVPAEAHGGKVEVTTLYGATLSAANFGITPQITSFTPTSGIVTSTFDVTGTGFNGVTAAKLGTKTAVVIVNSDTSATVTVPTGASSGKVSLTAAGVTGTSSGTFTVLPPPAVTAVAPAKAVEGATVKVTGTHFTGATHVTLNGNDVSFSAVTSTSLKFVVPSEAESGKVAVTTLYGTGVSATTFKITPAIASFAPSSGGVDSTITLTGSGFDEVSSAKLGTKTAAFEIVSDSSMTVTVPTGAVSGKVSVTAAGGTATSATSFAVSHDERALASARTVVTTRLSIDEWPGGRQVAAGHKHYTLACAPARGTVPHAARACSALAALSAPFAKPAVAAPCPALALGPQESHVLGVVRGVRVDAWLNLRGCGIGRWNRVKAIVPEPARSLSPA